MFTIESQKLILLIFYTFLIIVISSLFVLDQRLASNKDNSYLNGKPTILGKNLVYKYPDHSGYIENLLYPLPLILSFSVSNHLSTFDCSSLGHLLPVNRLLSYLSTSFVIFSLFFKAGYNLNNFN